MLEIFTIVLNGMPFVKEHLAIFNKLKVPWRWHIVEGVASPIKDTNWCTSVLASDHSNWLSNDGTTEYLDSIASNQVLVYRKPAPAPWNGKVEMCNAILPNISQGAVLHEVDVDEFWTAEQLETIYDLAANYDYGRCWYYCDFYLGPDIHLTQLENGFTPTDYTWIRTHKYAGEPWMAHEPPVIKYIGRDLKHAQSVGCGKSGLVFKHFGYSVPAQIKFKENYYQRPGLMEAWLRMQSNKVWPSDACSFFNWARYPAKIDRTEPYTDVIKRYQAP